MYVWGWVSRICCIFFTVSSAITEDLIDGCGRLDLLELGEILLMFIIFKLGSFTPGPICSEERYEGS